MDGPPRCKSHGHGLRKGVGRRPNIRGASDHLALSPPGPGELCDDPIDTMEKGHVERILFRFQDPERGNQLLLTHSPIQLFFRNDRKGRKGFRHHRGFTLTKVERPGHRDLWMVGVFINNRKGGRSLPAPALRVGWGKITRGKTRDQRRGRDAASTTASSRETRRGCPRSGEEDVERG